MALLSSLSVMNFRCFEGLEVGGLTRVNLIVGANNSGKSSLLEALEQVACGGSVRRLVSRLGERGESIGLPTIVSGGSETAYDPSALFSSRPRAGVRAEALLLSDRRRLSIKKTSLELTTDAVEVVQPPPLFAAHWSSVLVSQGGIRDEDFSRASSRGDELPTLAVSSAGLQAPQFRALWSRVDGNAEEATAIAALQILEPRIERVVAPGSANPTRGWQDVFLRFKGEKERVPLASFGEGTKRLLGFGVALASLSGGGTLLVDEIENGVHWKIMPRLWHFLVEAATKLDVQVFASTHSKDCLNALASLVRTDPALAAATSVHRLDPGGLRSIDTDAATAADLLDSDLELR